MFSMLLVTLPTQPSAVRVRVWRALKALGCAALRDGAYLLPEAQQALFEPLATDGEPALFLAQILGQEDRNAEAKAAAQQALAKGLKSPGNAWMAIARAEYYSDNIAGAQAAYREASKDPSTKAEAQKALAQISR